MKLLSRSKWASGATITSGVAMALVPKCPACVAAYFGFFSAFGVDRWAPDYLWPVTYTLFGASVAFLLYRAWRTASYAPFALALVGAAFLAGARLQDASAVVVWVGCGLFLLGALWSARRGRIAEAAPCHATGAMRGPVS